MTKRLHLLPSALVLLTLVASAADAYRLSAPFTGVCDSGWGYNRAKNVQGRWSANPKSGELHIDAFCGPQTGGWNACWAEASFYKPWKATFTGKARVIAVFSIWDGFEELYARPGQCWFETTIRVGVKGRLDRGRINFQSLSTDNWKIVAKYYHKYPDRGIPQTMDTIIDVRNGSTYNIAAGLNTVASAWYLFNYAQTAYNAKLLYIDVVKA